MFLVSKKYTSRFRANRASSYQKHVMNFPPYPVIRSIHQQIVVTPERILEAFFTSKEEGLGLVCRSSGLSPKHMVERLWRPISRRVAPALAFRLR